MYLAIDVGATKTLVAVFSKEGKLLHEQKIATSKKYDQFLTDLQSALQQSEFKDFQISACCCAIPGRVDRQNRVGVRFGNLLWQNVPIGKDLDDMLRLNSVLVENDAKLGGLFEASLVINEFKRVLYVPIGTGIGVALITDGVIDLDKDDLGGHSLMLDNHGKVESWEAFASGRALVKRFEKKAGELNNAIAWQAYAKDVAKGLGVLIESFQPDVIIISGSVGAHLEKFGSFLKDELKKYQNNMVQIPPIIKADKAEEAVIYGCYEYIKQNV